MQHVQATAALEHHSWRYRGSPTTLGELPRNSSTKGTNTSGSILGGFLTLFAKICKKRGISSLKGPKRGSGDEITHIR